MRKRQNRIGLPAIFGILLLLFIGSAIIVQLMNRHTKAVDSDQSKFLSHAGQALSLSLIAKDVVGGNKEAVVELQRLQDNLVDTKEIAALAERIDGVSADTARRAWGQLKQGIRGVVDGQEAFYSVLDSSASFAQLAPSFLNQIDGIAANLSPAEKSNFEAVNASVAAETRFSEHAIRELGNNITSRIATEEKVSASLDYLGEVIAALGGGPAANNVPSVQQDLSTLQESHQQLRTHVDRAIENGDLVAGIYRSSEQVESASQAIFKAAGVVRAALENKEIGWWQNSWLPLLLLSSAVISALALMLVHALSNRKQAQVTAVTTVENADKNQEAILRLLDEMGNLADGDLTVEATVTEDITGAIADSINYVIEALRDLVSTIDSGAESVDSAARQTRAAANHLAKASKNQSKQVSSATESIAKMATSIEQVSTNAERSSEVAKHSVEVAHKGGEAVRRTIEGMNTIRETIQDTSKRIKRLGESSQEIGNIVELINDIAEQTNILALNASIQASMAGEAGRGFGVVADEVQGLAERSTNATKQIEVLVKTIQSDTNEAVVSMERSTTDVVSGALLAENAGAALDEIEKVSNQIARLVQNISASARQQALVASDVTRNMGVLQEISAQTAENTNATSHAIDKLADMAAQMRQSVAGFTLPKEVKKETKDIEDEMLFHLATEENNFIDTLIVSEKIVDEKA